MFKLDNNVIALSKYKISKPPKLSEFNLIKFQVSGTQHHDQ